MLDRTWRRFVGALSWRKSDGGRAHTPPLLRLPQELVDNIVSLLDIPDAACLSICNRYLYLKLGVERLHLLRIGHEHEHERQAFLLQIARDNPDLFFCHVCSHLHRVTRVKPAFGWGCQRAIPCVRKSRPEQRAIPGQSFETYGGFACYKLTFPHVQLVMERHINGPTCGIPLSFLSVTEVDTSRTPQISTLLSVEPSIIDSELFLRVQHWIIFDQDDQPVFERLRGPGICSHITRYVGSTVLDLIQCQIQHIGERAGCPKCSLLYRCDQCSVEFESNTTYIDSRKVAVVITKWLNLGSGRTPTDPKWQRHLYPPWEGQSVPLPKNWIGSKSIFEEHTDKSQETATHAKASLLREDAFRNRLHRSRRVQLCED